MFQEISLPITEPVLIVALVLLVVLAAPLVFERLRMPGIIGLILAGVLIGPHTLGLLERDLTMEVLGTIGLLYIMFLAGLDINLHEFSKYRNRSIIFGALTFALPQSLGTLMAIQLLDFNWVQAILLGSVFASHTLLAYPIISRLGIHKTQAVTTAVGATIVTDTAALLVLAVIARSTEGETGVGFWLAFSALLLLYTFGLFWGLPRLGRWFFRRVRAGATSDYVFILAAVFTCAFLADFIGVESIIGAFLAGLALNRLVPEQSGLMSRIHFVGDALFIPFFLISVGMLVDLNVLVGGPEAWFVAGAMVATVVVTKWAAAMLTRPLFRYSVDKGWMLFGLTIPQAAATLAAVLIGYDLALFGEDVLNGTIVMILVTCLLGPWIADRYGRRVALEEAQAPFQPRESPQRVLVPLAKPQSEPHLIDLAILIREPGSTEPIFPLIVVRDGPDVQAQVAAGEKLLGHAIMHAAGANVPVHPLTRVDFNIATGILRAVKEQIASMIVVGWSGREIKQQFIFGSVLDQLISGSREMVLVSKIEEPLNTCRRLVVAVPPFSYREAGFATALRTITTLATQLGATVTFVAEQRTWLALQLDSSPTASSAPTNYVPVQAWTNALLTESLGEMLREDDLLVLLSTRMGMLSWRPALDLLPSVLAQRLDRRNFLVLYLPVCASAADLEEGRIPLRSALPTMPSDEQITIGVDGGSASALLHGMLQRSLRNRAGMLKGAGEALSSISPEHVPELHPGVIFYHAHAAELDAPLLLVGTNREGVVLPVPEHRVHLVFVLLSPDQDPPERHLRRLAALAHIIRTEGVLERLRSASSPLEVRRILYARDEPQGEAILSSAPT